MLLKLEGGGDKPFYIIFTLIPSKTRGASSLILDQNYINTKNQVIKAERRVLKELGFCVHVKHPHKVSSSTLIRSLHPTNGFIIGSQWRCLVSNNPCLCHPRSSSCTFKSWNVRRTKRWSRPPGKFLLSSPVSHNPQQQPASRAQDLLPDLGCQ